ncbi:MAG: hypothetical protein AAGH68_07085 [Pseudomonadota bacterium]
MPVLRFSACREGEKGNQISHMTVFGEASPGQLEDDARKSPLTFDNLTQQNRPPFFEQPIFSDDRPFAEHIQALPVEALGDPDAPVIVFVHGYMFDVRDERPEPFLRTATDNPHVLVYHFEEPASVDLERRRHHTPWLARAFFDDGKGEEADCDGLAVCWGYDGSGDTKRLISIRNPTGRPANSYELAYRDSGYYGQGLAAAISQLVRRLDGAGQSHRQIDIISHSLGTRTALKALETLAHRFPAPVSDPAIERVGKVLLLAGACQWYQAGTALERLIRSGATKLPEIYNIISKDDEVVRVLGARFSLSAAREEAGASKGDISRLWEAIVGGKTVGIEGKPDGGYTNGKRYAPWIDIDLDAKAVRDWGAARGLDLLGDAGQNQKDHWVHFTHAPNWELYRRILRSAPGYTLPELQASLPGV